MRENKYRGKQKDNGEWVHGYLLVYEPSNEWFIFSGYGDNALEYEVIPETVGQYTGIKDNAGREIWEGDIVNLPTWLRGSDFRPARVVCEHLGCIKFVALDNGVEYGTAHMGEVIGNIHDNAELIGG